MYIFVLERPFDEFKGEDVILFGAGSGGEKCLEEFEKLGANVVGFCDNNSSRWGTELRGYPILSPTELLSREGANVVIASTYDEEIRRQLHGLGLQRVYTARIGVLHDKIPFSQFRNGTYSKAEANTQMYSRVKGGKPFFAGRLGSTELECLSEYFYLLSRVNGSGIPYGGNMKMIIKEWTGFYPAEDGAMDRFCELYKKDLGEIDLLATMWDSRFEDRLFADFCPGIRVASYDDVAFPVGEETPWTSALRGKRVLVIHPFEASIRANYKKRSLLFQNPSFLPEFDLQTIKAVQSIGIEQPAYPTWFEALESMERQMEETPFDVALIGAGGYGFPLAAHAKRLGKQGILIGGMLQLYFGIKGKNWDDKGYYNEYWTRPLEDEKPKGYQRVEAGRYW